jgi:hypothetical protein
MGIETDDIGMLSFRNDVLIGKGSDQTDYYEATSKRNASEYCHSL